MLIIEDFTLRGLQTELLSVPHLHIPSGERALLCADNSRGKSLLLKAIKDHYRDYHGSIQLREPEGSKHKGNACIMIELGPHLLRDQTIWQNLVLPFRKLTGMQEMRIRHYLKIAGFEDLATMKVQHCSFAQMKLVELVRASIIEPYLLLVDDLDKFFDHHVYEKALQFLEHLNVAGTSILATSVVDLHGFTTKYTIQNKVLVSC